MSYCGWVGGWVGGWDVPVLKRLTISTADSTSSIGTARDASVLNWRRPRRLHLVLVSSTIYCRGWVGGWLGGWVGWVEEKQAVGMSYCELWVGG